MNRDPSGYYACLGVAVDASYAEIKSAYRALAKKLHPDVNADPVARHRFAALAEAYSVIGDPDKRAEYDAVAYEEDAANAQDNEPLDPIKCTVCHQATASPRSLVFRSVVSLIFTTVTTPRHGIFCSKCARKTAFKASLSSGLFGWWGVPWGPILTIKEIVRNALGGQKHPEADEKLSYYNALAFASRGQFALAHAIARQLRNARDERLARDAMRLVDELEKLGVPDNSPVLKDVWRKTGKDWFLHVASLTGVPILIFFLISASDGGASRTSPPQLGVNSGTALVSQGSSGLKDQPDIGALKTCENIPQNGQEFDRISSRGDGHRITIKNGGNGDAIVKVKDIIRGRTVSVMFVERGKQASFNNIPDGEYSIFFATGEYLDESCKKFIGNFQAKKFPGSETFRTKIEGDYIFYSDLTLTLYNVSNGNTRPQHVSDAEFDGL